jgi:hypothetical protein
MPTYSWWPAGLAPSRDAGHGAGFYWVLTDQSSNGTFMDAY